jgi:signal transduction histidine kinase/CheY-like chemotaxis protein
VTVDDQGSARELAYYKRQLDELAAARIVTEQRQWALQSQLRQKRQGFLLLSRLTRALGGQSDPVAMFGIAALEINTVLGMDRTVILVPDEGSTYRPVHLAGFPEPLAREVEALSFPAAELIYDAEVTLVRRATPSSPAVDRWRACFGLISFVALPVLGAGSPMAFIVSGRVREDASFCPPLDDGDADTFRAIAGTLSAVVDNTRLTLLEQTRRWKEDFFTELSHELRTPLSLTVGPLAQVLEGRWGDLPEAARERLQAVERNQDRLVELVNQILDLARLQADAAELHATPITDLNARVSACAEHFRTAAELRGLELVLDLDPALDGSVVHADAPRIERVLFNLLSNAFKFTDAGSVTVSTRRVGGGFELAVADTGIGMAAADVPRIFTRFARVPAAEARREAGSGIGLAIVDEIVALHGGQVSVDAEPGRGARFVVTIPEPAAETGAAAPAPLPDGEALDRLTEAAFDPTRPIVLCVEDDGDLRRYLRDILGADYNVFVAADGAEGLVKARRYLPDLIVTDQTMPGMDGRELLEALRADPDLAAIPVAFLTARQGLAGRIESLDAGADDYMTKPFHEDELRARARNLVRGHARERELSDANRRLELRVREQMAELVHSGELKRFLPRAVVETLARGELAPGRALQPQVVTALIAEVEGLASPGPLMAEALGGFLDDYLDAAVAIAAAHGGTVDSLAGGRVALLFGAPEPAEADASAWAAAQAAFEIRARVLELAAAARRRGLRNDWRVGIGIATGECLVGVVGGPTLRAFTAVGETAREAAALATRARGGAIHAAASTVERLAGRVRSRAVGDDESHELFERLAPGAKPAPAPARRTPAAPVAAGRVFRREGDYWTIAYGGAVFRLHDMKGLEYLARLLAVPRTSVHVLDLVAPLRLADPAAGRLAAAEGLVVRQGEDAGAVLDGPAKAAYRHRLRELDEELEQARSFADEARTGRLERELELLARELSSAIGLGGRDRRAASVAERARVNVVRAIKSALSKIAPCSTQLERHLRASVRTGTFCCYTPHPGVPESWDVHVP